MSTKRKQPERTAKQIKAQKKEATKPKKIVKKPNTKSPKKQTKLEDIVKVSAKQTEKEPAKTLSEGVNQEVAVKKAKIENPALDQLKLMTKVVADTGDFTSIEKYKPEDATTNPSLVLQSVKTPQCEQLIVAAVKV